MKAQFIKSGKALGLTGAALLAYVENALAAVPAAVTTAITDAGTDAATVAGAVLVAVIALMAFHWMRREGK